MSTFLNDEGQRREQDQEPELKPKPKPKPEPKPKPKSEGEERAPSSPREILQRRITSEWIERWRAGDKGAERELLWDSGLVELYKPYFERVGRERYANLRRTNSWLPVRASTSSIEVEGKAFDGLLKVLEELKKREKGFSSVEEFLDVLEQQTRRRIRDYLVKEVIRQGGQVPDVLEGEGGEEEEAETLSEHLPRAPTPETDPGWYARRHQQCELLLRLFRGLRNALEPRRRLLWHYDVVSMAHVHLYSREGLFSVLARLFEFLMEGETRERGRGRRHDVELTRLVMDRCCGKRNTYDAAHNLRLRHEWRKFLDGVAQEDFERLQGLLGR